MRNFTVDDRNPQPLCFYWHGVTDLRHEYLDQWSDTTDRFRRQIDWLRGHRKVVSLSALVEWIQGDEEVDPQCVVLTFDDALFCQQMHAFKVLDEYDLPYALSIPTQSIDTGKPIWCSTLAYAVFTTQAREISFSGHQFAIPRSPKDRISVHSAVRATLFAMNEEGLALAIDEIFEQLSEECEAASRHATYRPMSWEQIAKLKRCTFVAHSHRHFPFNRFESAESLAREIRQSKERIQHATGQEVSFFCLPYGFYADKQLQPSAMLKAHGIRACLTSEKRPVDACRDRFYLPRIDAQRWL
jgi:peptidoglycan/xylan/chitin deacetylase (PgdA/CDA1 family)